MIEVPLAATPAGKARGSTRATGCSSANGTNNFKHIFDEWITQPPLLYFHLNVFSTEDLYFIIVLIFKKAKDSVKIIVIDLYSPYISWMKNLFPKTQVMINKFHIHPFGRVTCLYFCSKKGAHFPSLTPKI